MLSSDTADFEADVARHRQARDRKLRLEHGWLSLVGRHVLEPGANPLDLGVVHLVDGEVRVAFKPGVAARDDAGPIREFRWAADDRGGERRFWIGTQRYELLRQGERAILRVRDPQSPRRVAFPGLSFYPADPRWRVVAQLQREEPPRRVVLATGAGGEDVMWCPGTLVFQLGGQELRVDPFLESPDATQLFLLFQDASNADQTYGAGRFLYAALPDRDGKVVLDFNKAFNPPCALTPFASCPVSPRQNRLPIRVEAGEKAPVDQHG